MAITEKSIEEWKASLITLAEKGANGMTKEDYNVISKPKHYMLFDETYIKNCSELELGIEVRDVLAKLVGKFYKNCENLPDQPSCSLFESDYVQLMQYLMRFMDKNGVEDLKKARWYLDKMISAY